jgi:cathepsin E
MSLTGATLDKGTGLLKVTSAQFADLKTLNFVIGGVCILYRRRSVWKL